MFSKWYTRIQNSKKIREINFWKTCTCKYDITRSPYDSIYQRTYVHCIYLHVHLHVYILSLWTPDITYALSLANHIQQMFYLFLHNKVSHYH